MTRQIAIIGTLMLVSFNHPTFAQTNRMSQATYANVKISDIRVSRTAHFEQLDTNKDGRLTTKEASKIAREQPIFNFARADMDFDGSLDINEFVEAPMSILTAIDANADGFVSQNEIDDFRMSARDN